MQDDQEKETSTNKVQGENKAIIFLKNFARSMDVCRLCCIADVSATGRSLVQESPTECVSLCEQVQE
jgi:hypothetical protein